MKSTNRAATLNKYLFVFPIIMLPYLLRAFDARWTIKNNKHSVYLFIYRTVIN